ncbi:MAG: PstC family ABC transporter permease, partial [Planctomycetota bacterium]
MECLPGAFWRPAFCLWHPSHQRHRDACRRACRHRSGDLPCGNRQAGHPAHRRIPGGTSGGHPVGCLRVLGDHLPCPFASVGLCRRRTPGDGRARFADRRTGSGPHGGSHITAVTLDALRAVPVAQRMGAYALGATRWQTIWSVVLPNARSGIIGGGFLALGRALGETMAVAMVIG